MRKSRHTPARPDLATLLYSTLAYAASLPLLLVLGWVVMAPPGLTRRRRWASVALKIIFRSMGVRWRIEGLENLPATPCIVVGNHSSYLDGPILQMLLPPRFSFAIMEEVKGLPPAHWLLTRLGSTFITRTNARQAARQTRVMLRKLEEGDSLGIFAEGRMGKPDQLQRFQRGAFMLATRGADEDKGTPVVPILLRGPERLLPAGSWVLRPARLHIRVLTPVFPQGSGKEAAEQMSQVIQTRMQDALDEALRTEGRLQRPSGG